MNSFNNKNPNNNCPCRDCHPPVRHFMCHSKCGKYAEWREKLNERNKRERDAHMANDTISEASKRKMWRNKRYANHHSYKSNYNSEKG